MKIKAIDIARELGLSKATVSMALNGKPGVSAKTKKAVLECKEQLERGDRKPLAVISSQENRVQRIIKLVTIRTQAEFLERSELDLWTDVREVITRIAGEHGYLMAMAYFQYGVDSLETFTSECNAELVAGVVVMGTELKPEHTKLFSEIKKPLVIYDSDIGSDAYPCVLVDNRGGIKKAVDYFVKRGIRDIHYYANAGELFNFDERRKAFREALQEHMIGQIEDRIHIWGKGTEEIYRNFKDRMTDNLPEAVILENYQVSIAVLRALREKGVKVPEDISLIGVDELPGYLTGDCSLTAIQIPHTERARWGITTLFKEMERISSWKAKVYVNCKLIEGDSVKTVME